MLRGWPRGCQGQGWLRIGSLGGALLVEPHLLHAAPTVDRMVRDEVLHVRPRREVVESPDEARPHGRLFQFSLDLLHQRHALLLTSKSRSCASNEAMPRLLRRQRFRI